MFHTYKIRYRSFWEGVEAEKLYLSSAKLVLSVRWFEVIAATTSIRLEVKEIFTVLKYIKRLQIGFNWIRLHDLHDTGAMFYRLSYEALPEAGQVRV